MRDGGASFRTTRWSVIADCALTDGIGSAAALAELCRDYWPPLYSFVRRRGYSPADAQDLVQGFFTHFLQDDRGPDLAAELVAFLDRTVGATL